MSIIVKRIINKPIDSNCFIVFTKENNKCIIIDPGSEDSSEIISFIKGNELIPKYIFLTHEHFDHIWSVNELKTEFDIQLCCSPMCSDRIINKKKNLSLFYNQVGFETHPSDLIVSPNESLSINSISIKIIDTPGHTDSSICIQVENNLFTGDTIIDGEKTPVKLPTGSLEALNDSLILLKNMFRNYSDVDIYPGHGNTFKFSDFLKQEL